MKNWNNLSKKLPKINEEVYILSVLNRKIIMAKLQVSIGPNFSYINGMTKEEGIRKENDLYWIIKHFKKEPDWALTIDYPYWMEKEELLKLVLDKKELEKTNRFEIMDLTE